MPFVEMATSKQDIEFDALGHLALRRVFKVWGAQPSVIYTDPTSVPNADPNNPFVPTLPDFGDVLSSSITGPGGVTGSTPQNPGHGVATSLFLYRYTTQAISPVLFYAIAHYTNDPNAAPFGLGYTSVEQFSLVNIPYVRKAYIIRAGAASGTTYTLVRDTKPEPMGVKKIKQEVLSYRKDRATIEAVITAQTGRIHDLPTIGFSRFDGGDVRMHSPQWLACTYNWTWEQGVTTVGQQQRTEPITASVQAIYPVGRESLDPRMGGDSIRVLHPFHTIDLQKTFDIQAAGVALEVPIWVYRLPYMVDPNGWQSLVDSTYFEWSQVP